MHKHALAGALLFLFPLAVYSQTSGNLKTLPGFVRIEISGNISAVMEKGAVNSIALRTRQGSLDNLMVTLAGSTLIISESPGMFVSRRTEVIISCRENIAGIEVNRGARVRIQNDIFTETAEVRALSGSSMDIYVSAENMNIESGRNSRITLKGKGERLDARAYDSGVIDALDFRVKKVYAAARTGGSVRVNALEYLEAGAGLESEIIYRGEPEKILFSSASGGSYIKTD